MPAVLLCMIAPSCFFCSNSNESIINRAVRIIDQIISRLWGHRSKSFTEYDRLNLTDASNHPESEEETRPLLQMCCRAESTRTTHATAHLTFHFKIHWVSVTVADFKLEHVQAAFCKVPKSQNTKISQVNDGSRHLTFLCGEETSYKLTETSFLQSRE